MDDEQQTINPNAPQSMSGDTDPVAEQARVRLTLQRRLSQADAAEMLSESIPHPRRRRRVRRLLITLAILIGIGAMLVWLLNMIVIPRLVASLPSLVRSPYATLPGYKRVIKGFIDYYPPVATSASKIALSEFDHGAAFSFISSADVIPHSGMEGVLRLDLERTSQASMANDLDLGYKVLFENPDGIGLYFFFNEWPAFLQQIGLTGESRGVWFGSDADSDEISQEGIRELAGMLNPEQRGTERQQFIAELWRFAAAEGAVRWKIEDLYASDSSGARVVRVIVALDPEKFETALASFTQSASYTASFRSIGETQFAGTTIIGVLRSVRSLQGVLTIGIADRFIHDASWTFDINDPSAGTYRGTLSTSLSTVATKKAIVKPEATQSALSILSLFVGEQEFSQASGDVIDSDSDGLDDAQEKEYDTDPLVVDTDGDGYGDGDEVRTGYDPNGPGVLLAD